MNRLTNYLEYRKIAQGYVQSAESATAKGNDSKAVSYLCFAIRYLILANNNLQSLAFNQKPKTKRRLHP